MFSDGGEMEITGASEVRFFALPMWRSGWLPSMMVGKPLMERLRRSQADAAFVARVVPVMAAVGPAPGVTIGC